MPFCIFELLGGTGKEGFLEFANTEGGKHAPSGNLYIPCPLVFWCFSAVKSSPKYKYYLIIAVIVFTDAWGL